MWHHIPWIEDEGEEEEEKDDDTEDEDKITEYDTYVCEFGSEYIRQKVIEGLGTQLENYFHSLVEHSEGNIYFGQLRGRLFEDLAHKKILTGGQFTIRNLDDFQDGTLLLEESNLKEIKTVDDIGKAQEGHYLKPIASNFPSIDSLIYPNMLFQMMTGRYVMIVSIYC